VGRSVEKEGCLGCSTESMETGRGVVYAEPSMDSMSLHDGGAAGSRDDCPFGRDFACGNTKDRDCLPYSSNNKID